VGPQVKHVMTQKPCKTVGNLTPVHSKTMCVSTANSGNTTMTQLNTGKTCSKCGMGLEWFDVCKDGELIGIALECPDHGITR